jgi:hypothetical protein
MLRVLVISGHAPEILAAILRLLAEVNVTIEMATTNATAAAKMQQAHQHGRQYDLVFSSGYLKDGPVWGTLRAISQSMPGACFIGLTYYTADEATFATTFERFENFISIADVAVAIPLIAEIIRETANADKVAA